MTALTRRQALGRLAAVAAGAVAVAALPTLAGAALVAPVPDPDLYHGPIWTGLSDDPDRGVQAVMGLRWPPSLSICPIRTPPSVSGSTSSWSRSIAAPTSSGGHGAGSG